MMEILKFEIREGKRAAITWRPFPAESTIFPMMEIEHDGVDLTEVQLHPDCYDLEWDGENNPRITKTLEEAEPGWKQFYCVCGHYLGAIHLKNAIDALGVKGGGYFECSKCHQVTTILEGQGIDQDRLKVLMTELKRCNEERGYFVPTRQRASNIMYEIMEIVRKHVGVGPFEYRGGF